MTSERLVSLTDEELAEIALKYNIVLPQDREVLIADLIEELDLLRDNGCLHASLKRYEFNASCLIKTDDGLISSQFPTYYNQNLLYCVMLDPYWVFVDWEIAKSSYQASLKSSGFNGFFLRIIEVAYKNGEEQVVDRCDYAIHGISGHCSVKIPCASFTHKVALFADLSGVEALIAFAPPIFSYEGVVHSYDRNENSEALRALASREC